MSRLDTGENTLPGNEEDSLREIISKYHVTHADGEEAARCRQAGGAAECLAWELGKQLERVSTTVGPSNGLHDNFQIQAATDAVADKLVFRHEKSEPDARCCCCLRDLSVREEIAAISGWLL